MKTRVPYYSITNILICFLKVKLILKFSSTNISFTSIMTWAICQVPVMQRVIRQINKYDSSPQNINVTHKIVRLWYLYINMIHKL